MHVIKPAWSKVVEGLLYSYGFPDAPDLTYALMDALESYVRHSVETSHDRLLLSSIRTAFRNTAGRFFTAIPVAHEAEARHLEEFRRRFFGELWSQLDCHIVIASLNKRDANHDAVMFTKEAFLRKFSSSMAKAQRQAATRMIPLEELATPVQSPKAETPSSQATEEAAGASSDERGADVEAELTRLGMGHLLTDDLYDFFTDASWVESNDLLLKLIEDSMVALGLFDVRSQVEATLQVWRAFQSNVSPVVIVVGEPSSGKSSIHRVLLELVRRIGDRFQTLKNAEAMKRMLGHLKPMVLLHVIQAFVRMIRRFKRSREARRASATGTVKWDRRQSADDDEVEQMKHAGKQPKDLSSMLWELIRYGYLSFEDLVGWVNDQEMWNDGILTHTIRKFAMRRLHATQRHDTATELGVEEEFRPPSVIALDGPWNELIDSVLTACQPMVHEALPTAHPFSTAGYKTNKLQERPHHLCLPNGQRVPIPPSVKIVVEVCEMTSASPATVTAHPIVAMHALPSEICQAMLASFIRRSNAMNLCPIELRPLLSRLLVVQDHIQAGLAFPDSLLNTHLNYKVRFPPHATVSMVTSRVSSVLTLLEYSLNNCDLDVGGHSTTLDMSRDPESAAARSKSESYQQTNRFCSIFLFSYVWGLGAFLADADDRRAFSEFVRERLVPEFGPQFFGIDPQGILFEYLIDFQAPSLQRLNADHPPSWLPRPFVDQMPRSLADSRVYSELNALPNVLFFPTSRTMYTAAVMIYMLKAGKTPTLAGKAGVGKTGLVAHLLRTLGNDVVESEKMLQEMIKDPTSFDATEEQINRRMGSITLRNMLTSFTERITEIAEVELGRKRKALTPVEEETLRMAEDPLGTVPSYWNNLASLRSGIDSQRCTSVYVSLNLQPSPLNESGGSFLERCLQRERAGILEPPPGMHGVIFIDDLHIATDEVLGADVPGARVDVEGARAWKEALRGLLDYQHDYVTGEDRISKLSAPFFHARPSLGKTMQEWLYFPKDSMLNRCSLITAARLPPEGSKRSADSERFCRHLIPVFFDNPSEYEVQQVRVKGV
jgi:hypothetical protein